jgi:hypothetical protein
MILDLLTMFFLIGGFALLWWNLRSRRDVIVTRDEQQSGDYERKRTGASAKQDTPF